MDATVSDPRPLNGDGKGNYRINIIGNSGSGMLHFKLAHFLQVDSL
jgi:hypothetical protein